MVFSFFFFVIFIFNRDNDVMITGTRRFTPAKDKEKSRTSEAQPSGIQSPAASPIQSPLPEIKSAKPPEFTTASSPAPSTAPSTASSMPSMTLDSSSSINSNISLLTAASKATAIEFTSPSTTSTASTGKSTSKSKFRGKKQTAPGDSGSGGCRRPIGGIGGYASKYTGWTGGPTNVTNDGGIMTSSSLGGLTSASIGANKMEGMPSNTGNNGTSKFSDLIKNATFAVKVTADDIFGNRDSGNSNDNRNDGKTLFGGLFNERIYDASLEEIPDMMKQEKKDKEKEQEKDKIKKEKDNDDVSM